MNPTHLCLPGLLLLAGPWLSGCGGPEPVSGFSARFQWFGPLDNCAERTDLGAHLTATLEVASFLPCPLTVDPETLEASGTCDVDIFTGLVRSLGLRYSYDDSDNGGGETLLVFMVSWVDLRSSALGKAEKAEVDFATNDPVIISDDTELEDLPESKSECEGLMGTDRNLCEAKLWAKTGPLKDATFDRDNTPPENIQEACDGTLLD